MEKYFIYYRQLNRSFEVTREQYYSYYDEIWRYRKARQRAQECAIPKHDLLYCDTDCVGCKYRRFPHTLYLDAPIETSDSEVSMHELIPGDTPTPEDVLMSELNATEYEDGKRRVAELLQSLPEIYGQAYELILRRATLEASAAELGITVKQFRGLKKKLYQMIEHMLK